MQNQTVVLPNICGNSDTFSFQDFSGFFFKHLFKIKVYIS